jgi:acetyltransferase-like isoleucine patch superfamily enzyme
MYARGVARGHPGALIGPRVKIRCRDNGTLQLGPGSTIGAGSGIAIKGTTLTLGERASVGARCRINVQRRIEIGAFAEISWDVHIMDCDFHKIREIDGTSGDIGAPVVIGQHALVGARAIILKGVTIGEGAVIAAGSVVTRDVPPNVIAAGNPARVVRSIASWT